MTTAYPDFGNESELRKETLEDQLFGKLLEADREHTEVHGINDINDWDEMLECEVRHFNTNNGTNFDPKEYRIQYCERQEQRTWGR